MMQPITILIADDHQLVREAWALVLEVDARFKVLETCGTAESAIFSAEELKPNIVLLDINLPGMSGIEAVPMINEASPHSRIIGVSLYTSPKFVRKMMQHGAYGYVTKNSSITEMKAAILSVQAGEKYICHAIKEIITEQFSMEANEENRLYDLSRRELEIIEGIKKGLSSKGIADELSISYKTVEVHRYNILKKLQLKNVAALINFINKNELKF
jgi:DNA-binding NarL/FixJ family response regulator